MSINDRLKANRERYERKLADIQQDNDLTAEAKARKLRPVFEEAKAVDSKLRGQRMADLREKVRDTEREAFAPPPLRGADPALLQLGYRHALDSVEPLTDAGELSRKLDRANSTGDKTLARAVAWRANQIGADGVVRAYLDSDEDANRKWAAWAEASREHRTALSAIREARSNLELLAKLLGELDERPVVNVLVSPQWLQLRTTIITALDHHPQARESVLRAVEGAGSG